MEVRDQDGTLIEVGDTVRRIHSLSPYSTIKREVMVKEIDGQKVWGDDGLWTLPKDLKVIATSRVKDADGRIIRVGDRLVYADNGDPFSGSDVVKKLSWDGYSGTEAPIDAVTFEDNGWIPPNCARVIEDTPTKDDAPVAEAADDSYAAIGAEIGRLVTEKQAAYGDAFGKAGQALRIMYPDGISHEQMDDALTITRILDKLFRIATDKDAFGESPYRDIAGYCLLALKRKEQS